MNAVTDLKSHARQMSAVREAVNVRAKHLRCSDEVRRHAVNVGILAVSNGRSAAAAIQEGWKSLAQQNPRMNFTPPKIGAPQT